MRRGGRRRGEGRGRRRGGGVVGGVAVGVAIGLAAHNSEGVEMEAVDCPVVKEEEER